MKQAGQGGQPGPDGQGGQGQGGKGDGQDANAVPGAPGGEWQPNDPNQPAGQGAHGGGGIANGGQTRDKAVAGFDTKVEHDMGVEAEKGKILASTMIRDNKPLINKSKLGLAQVTESIQKQESEEVDEDHVSGQSRKAAEEYFRTMKNDVKAPAPAPAPAK